MIWYSAWYGNWTGNNTVTKIEGSFSFEDIRKRAEVIAQETGETVAIQSERGSVKGLTHRYWKVYPSGETCEF